MINGVFINEAFEIAIQNYLKNKEGSLYATVPNFYYEILSLLVFIYGELDIINPYKTKNEVSLGGFDNNITKFGYSKQRLSEFKIAFQEFLENERVGKENYKNFVFLSKQIIDMFFYKMKSLGKNEEEIQRFYQQLSSFETKFFETILKKKTIVKEYYESRLYELRHPYVLVREEVEMLSREAYEIAGYNYNTILTLKPSELLNVNQKVYAFFKVKMEDENRLERLRDAVTYYRRYGNIITSGNGYVDLLLLVSILATTLLVMGLAISGLVR